MILLTGEPEYSLPVVPLQTLSHLLCGSPRKMLEKSCIYHCERPGSKKYTQNARFLPVSASSKIGGTALSSQTILNTPACNNSLLKVGLIGTQVTGHMMHFNLLRFILPGRFFY